MPESPYGCAKPSPGPISSSEPQAEPETKQLKQEVFVEKARVGKPAPDFELIAFQGEGFKNVRLSDHKGKWILVCFYPGDFTFV